MIEKTEKIVVDCMLDPRIQRREKILTAHHKKLMIKMEPLFQGQTYLKEGKKITTDKFLMINNEKII